QGSPSRFRSGAIPSAARNLALILPLEGATPFHTSAPTPRSRRLRYSPILGARKAFITTVASRSYSRNSGRISWETEMGNRSSFSACATTLSFVGLRYEKRKQTAIDSTRKPLSLLISLAIAAAEGLWRILPSAV